MSVFVDSRPHAAAAKAAIDTHLGPNDVYDYDEVPGTNGNEGTLPDICVIVSVLRRYNPNLRMSAQAGSAGWRVSARGVGTTVDECRWALLKVADALNENRLSIDGRETTPIQFESEQLPVFKDGHYSALNVYTYAH